MAQNSKNDYIASREKEKNREEKREKERKKRSTQSSLTTSETRSVKIFTSCCLMQL